MSTSIASLPPSSSNTKFSDLSPVQQFAEGLDFASNRVGDRTWVSVAQQLSGTGNTAIVKGHWPEFARQYPHTAAALERVWNPCR